MVRREDIPWEDLQRLNAQGWSYRRLAEKYGVCDGAFGERLRRLVRRALEIKPFVLPDFSTIGKAAEKAKADKKNADDGNIRMAVGVRKGEWTLFSLPFEKYRAGLEEIAGKLRARF